MKSWKMKYSTLWTYQKECVCVKEKEFLAYSQTKKWYTEWHQRSNTTNKYLSNYKQLSKLNLICRMYELLRHNNERNTQTKWNEQMNGADVTFPNKLCNSSQLQSIKLNQLLNFVPFTNSPTSNQLAKKQKTPESLPLSCSLPCKFCRLCAFDRNNPASLLLSLLGSKFH